MEIGLIGSDGELDGRFSVDLEWCGYPEQRWALRFNTMYRGSAKRPSEAWNKLLREYCERMDYKMEALAVRRITDDESVQRHLREEWLDLAELPDGELSNIAVGLCFEQTGYGLPWTEYCDTPAVGNGALYCADHLRQHRLDGIGSGAAGMPNWLPYFE